jgi:CheY-like chemotaxis protein
VPVEALLIEIRAIRAMQEQILELLQNPPAEPAGAASPSMSFGFGADSDDAPPPPPSASVRSRRRKSVLLIDDDAATSKAARAALEAADVPVRAVGEGNAALAAIAAEKPDVIAMELAMGGAMGGKDVINMIKATMEWVDIPILLYTRAPVESQKEARTIHGADDYVLKGPQGPQLLVTRVIAMFRGPKA